MFCPQSVFVSLLLRGLLPKVIAATKVGLFTPNEQSSAKKKEVCCFMINGSMTHLNEEPILYHLNYRDALNDNTLFPYPQDQAVDGYHIHPAVCPGSV